MRRTRGQRHVLWIISHPEVIEIAELDAADLVLVASDRFAAELRTRTRTPVESFLQATDTSRFRPFPPDAAHVHDVTVVAKSRDQYRTAVADAIAGGLRPSIYGSGWERHRRSRAARDATTSTTPSSRACTPRRVSC